MKFFQLLALATAAAAVAIEPRHQGRRKGNSTTAVATASATATSSVASADPTAVSAVSDAADGQTVVLKEVNGVPGNECLTFRNNGEMVDAACVNTAADRQITPDTINGQSVLRVQRTFTAGFRPDLVDVDACVGFNGTTFLAEDCAASAVQNVVFTGSELRTADGSVCASGHDDMAQLTVDTTGTTCATYTVTDVQPATS